MKNIIGFQIVSADGKNHIPEEFYSFEIFNEINDMLYDTFYDKETYSMDDYAKMLKIKENIEQKDEK